MIPLILQPSALRLALVGRGELAIRRLEWLIEGGAKDLAVFSDDPAPALAARAGDLLREHLPGGRDLEGVQVLWIADLPLRLARPLRNAARAAGALVSVEDTLPLCDFHNPSVVRRGDLLLTVSTAGRSPGLAARIRQRLERTFGPEWAERLEIIGARRTAWKRRARSLPELARLSDALIDRRRWLPEETVSR
ncbi:MAG: precorrin-2 dehydrogenase/sirohydrochlorin ferrochelatase family protein [Geminicoccales bacterium]